MRYRVDLVVEIETPVEEVYADSLRLSGANANAFAEGRAIIYGNESSNWFDIAGIVKSAQKVLGPFTSDDMGLAFDYDPFLAGLMQSIGRSFIYVVGEIWDPAGGVIEQFVNKLNVPIYCYCDGKALERDPENPSLVTKSELTAIRLSPMPGSSGDLAKIWAIKPIIEEEKNGQGSVSEDLARTEK